MKAGDPPFYVPADHYIYIQQAGHRDRPNGTTLYPVLGVFSSLQKHCATHDAWINIWVLKKHPTTRQKHLSGGAAASMTTSKLGQLLHWRQTPGGWRPPRDCVQCVASFELRAAFPTNLGGTIGSQPFPSHSELRGNLG